MNRSDVYREETYQKLTDLGGTFRDIDYQPEVRVRLEESTKKIIHFLNEGQPTKIILDQLYELLSDIFQFDRLGIALYDKDQSQLKLFWVRAKSTIKEIDKNFETKRISKSLKQILETGEPRIIYDMSEYFDAHPDSETTPLILYDGVKSSVTCPLHMKGKNLGIIFFSSYVPYTYELKQIPLFKEISEIISLIINVEFGNSQKYRQ